MPTTGDPTLDQQALPASFRQRVVAAMARVSPLVIVFFLCVLCSLLTFIIPGGLFERPLEVAPVTPAVGLEVRRDVRDEGRSVPERRHSRPDSPMRHCDALRELSCRLSQGGRARRQRPLLLALPRRVLRVTRQLPEARKARRGTLPAVPQKALTRRCPARLP